VHTRKSYWQAVALRSVPKTRTDAQLEHGHAIERDDRDALHRNHRRVPAGWQEVEVAVYCHCQREDSFSTLRKVGAHRLETEYPTPVDKESGHACFCRVSRFVALSVRCRAGRCGQGQR
jgi:hypothetical protein